MGVKESEHARTALVTLLLFSTALVPNFAGAQCTEGWQAPRVLEAADGERSTLGDDYLSTEHILLALLELEDGDGPLYAVGLDKDEVEGHVLAVLASLVPTDSSVDE